MNAHTRVDEPVHVYGAAKTQSFQINDSPAIFAIMSDAIYSRPKDAVIREYLTNAHDAHLAAGTTSIPIKVAITTDPPRFTVEDQGTGLDADDVDRIFSYYFKSTKGESPLATGIFGIGGKSAFAFTNNFTLSSVKNGRAFTFAIHYNGTEAPKISLMVPSAEGVATDRPNGVTIDVPLPSPEMAEDFARLTATFLHTNTINATVLLNDKPHDLIPNRIGPDLARHGSALIVQNGPRHEGLTIVQGEIAYKISHAKVYEALHGAGIDPLLYSNVFLHVPSRTFVYPPSREQLRETTQNNEKLRSLMTDLQTKVMEIVTARALAFAATAKLADIFELHRTYRANNAMITGIERTVPHLIGPDGLVDGILGLPTPDGRQRGPIRTLFYKTVTARWLGLDPDLAGFDSVVEETLKNLMNDAAEDVLRAVQSFLDAGHSVDPMTATFESNATVWAPSNVYVPGATPETSEFRRKGFTRRSMSDMTMKEFIVKQLTSPPRNSLIIRRARPTSRVVMRYGRTKAQTFPPAADQDWFVAVGGLLVINAAVALPVGTPAPEASEKMWSVLKQVLDDYGYLSLALDDAGEHVKNRPPVERSPAQSRPAQPTEPTLRRHPIITSLHYQRRHAEAETKAAAPRYFLYGLTAKRPTVSTKIYNALEVVTHSIGLKAASIAVVTSVKAALAMTAKGIPDFATERKPDDPVDPVCFDAAVTAGLLCSLAKVSPLGSQMLLSPVRARIIAAFQARHGRPLEDAVLDPGAIGLLVHEARMVATEITARHTAFKKRYALLFRAASTEDYVAYVEFIDKHSKGPKPC